MRRSKLTMRDRIKLQRAGTDINTIRNSFEARLIKQRVKRARKSDKRQLKDWRA